VIYKKHIISIHLCEGDIVCLAQGENPQKSRNQFAQTMQEMGKLAQEFAEIAQKLGKFL
jgi:hypothetical protein